MFKREIKITPAWDSGTRQQGCRCCDLLFLLHTPKGALVFEVFTGWYLSGKHRQTSAASLAFHAISPVVEDSCFHEECDWLDGKPCYSHRLGYVSELWGVLIEKGSEGLWEEMERFYQEHLEPEPEWLVEPYEQMARSVGA